MCTVTIVPNDRGLIVTMNRDESKSRDEALPHILYAKNSLTRWYGVDKETSGSWFGVNGRGMVACLLNRYQQVNEAAVCSRGVLVPHALSLGDLDDVLRGFVGYPWEQHSPCDLVLIQGHRLAQLSWTGSELIQTCSHIDAPVMFTSSSQGYDEALAFREGQFRLFMKEATGADELGADSLLAFHRRTHAQNPSIGVFMQRPDRHTKSICQLESQNGQLKVRYLATVGEMQRVSADDAEAWHQLWQ